MHYNITLHHNKVTNCITKLVFMEIFMLLFAILFLTWAGLAYLSFNNIKK